MEQISDSFKTFKSYEISASIIHSIAILRNSCAHHARIWNNKIVRQISKRLPIKTEPLHNRSYWRVICILMALVDEIEPEIKYSDRVQEICKSNKEFFKGLIYPTIYYEEKKMFTNAKIYYL